MNINKFSFIALSLLITFTISLPAWAQVGRVLYTFGQVSVERPAITRLRKGDTVEEGDVIVTSRRAYAQIRLDDGTKIALRPNSRFVIEAVEAPATATRPAIGAGTTLKASFNLQKGGFRTITGRIARRDPSAYQVRTPSALIRVQGTNYLARLCAADCGGSDDGLYVGVSNGDVSMSNAAGDLDLARNQYGFAANFNTPPTRLIAPPQSLQDDALLQLEEEEEEEGDSSDEESEGESGDEDESADEEGSDDESQSDDSSDDASDDASDESGDDSAEGADDSTESMAADREGDVSTDAAASTSTETTADSTISVDEPDQEITAVLPGGGEVDLTQGESTGHFGFSYSSSDFATGINLTEVGALDESGGLTSFNIVDSGNQTVSVNIGTAQNLNIGFDPNSELRWGRWANGVATQTTDTSQADMDLTSSSLHWISSPAAEAPEQTITGSASFTLRGNTDPTDNLGNVGVLGSASLSADFTNQVVQSSLQLGINNQVWTATGSGSINANLFEGLYDTVTVGGSSTGSGSFGGIFTGFGDGLPSGAGLNYHLINESTTVNGAAIFYNMTNSAP